MASYFKFEIPTMEDGSRITYSPGWHGTMPKCPTDVTVLLYNDEEGYGIAKTEDTFIPKEVTVLVQEEAEKLISSSISTLVDGVSSIYFSKSLIPEGYDLVKNSIEDRWDELMEVTDGR